MQLFAHFTANNIKLDEMPFLRELSMEAYLVENPEVLCLDDDDFSQVDIIETELALKEGRKSKHGDGRIDILSLYNNSTLSVIELKLGELTEVHLEQLEDYLKEKKRIIEYVKGINQELNNLDERTDFIGVLVGTGIKNDLAEKLKGGYNVYGEIPIVGLTLKRFRGKDNQIYVLTETYFKNTSRNFDYTKYQFLGNTYGKGKLVLAIITHYVSEHPKVTYSELKREFPDSLHGAGHIVVATLEEANKYPRKRHFIKNCIRLSDETDVAVTSQWDKFNIGNVLKKAKALGYVVEEVK